MLRCMIAKRLFTSLLIVPILAQPLTASAAVPKGINITGKYAEYYPWRIEIGPCVWSSSQSLSLASNPTQKCPPGQYTARLVDPADADFGAYNDGLALNRGDRSKNYVSNTTVIIDKSGKWASTNAFYLTAPQFKATWTFRDAETKAPIKGLRVNIKPSNSRSHYYRNDNVLWSSLQVPSANSSGSISVELPGNQYSWSISDSAYEKVSRDNSADTLTENLELRPNPGTVSLSETAQGYAVPNSEYLFRPTSNEVGQLGLDPVRVRADGKGKLNVKLHWGSWTMEKVGSKVKRTVRVLPNQTTKVAVEGELVTVTNPVVTAVNDSTQDSDDKTTGPIQQGFTQGGIIAILGIILALVGLAAVIVPTLPPHLRPF